MSKIFELNFLKHGLPGRHWLMLALSVILLGLVAFFVDLKPRVDENFFFPSMTRSLTSLPKSTESSLRVAN
jgi:hypothetical protein